MRSLITFVCLISANYMSGQDNIGVVDFEKVLIQHPKKHYYDSIYNNKEKFYNDSISKAYKKYEYLYDLLDINWSKRNDSFNDVKKKGKKRYEIIEKRREAINNERDSIQEEIQNLGFVLEKLNKDRITHLENFESKHITILRDDILEVIRKYSIENDYLLIVLKNSTSYHSDKIDLTLIIQNLIQNKYKN